MRRFYAENRAVLAATLAPIADLGWMRGLEAGLHAFLELREGIDPERVVARCRERGVVVTTLADYYAGRPDRQGLLLGYGGLDPQDARNGARVVAEVVRDEASRAASKADLTAQRGRLVPAR